MRTNDEVMEDVEDTKLGDMNRAIRDGIYGESEGVETVVLKRNQEIFSGVPFSVFVDSVLCDEHGWVPHAVHVKHKYGDFERVDHSCHIPRPFTYEVGVRNK